ncbi:MAG: polyphenol oxidase family protein [Oscillospiraceae bacterium]|jgi:YfiH family protein|nr:polyphenol oxidase family protein [Oscillospiraceae bacterium]
MTSRGAFRENSVNGAKYMTAPNIAAVHAFMARPSGADGGGAAPARSLAYLEPVCGALGIAFEDLVFSEQVHGSAVLLVDEQTDAEHSAGQPGGIDALITAARGRALAVFTADCVPILLYDPPSGAVGAVHAGWRGTAADIAGAAAAAMVREFGCAPGDMRAAVGPCISRCCFETDGDVADAMASLFPGGGAERSGVVRRAGDKFRVDLKAANAALLERAGLGRANIAVSDECTRCLSDKYWSHRASPGGHGLQAAIIAPAPPRRHTA